MTFYLQTGELYAEAFIEVLEKLRAEKEETEKQAEGKKKEWGPVEFARRVFGYNSTAPGKYSCMTRGLRGANRPPQIPKLHEAHAMVNALGYNWITFLREVDERFEMKKKGEQSKKAPTKNLALK